MLRKYKARQDFNATVCAMLNTCLRKEHNVVVSWEHVPCKHKKQQWADWLGHCAHAAGKHVDLWSIMKYVPAEGASPKDLLLTKNVDQIAVGFHSEGSGALPLC